MSKEDFISVFELTLLCADLDVTGLSLVDDSNVLITFKGNGTRKVNIEADSFCIYRPDRAHCTAL